MSSCVRTIVAPVFLILAVQNADAQTWGQHGVTVHRVTTSGSPFDIFGLHVVNDLGQVVGGTRDATGNFFTGVFAPGAGVSYLSAPAGQSTLGWSINNAGEIAGYRYTSTTATQAFLYSGGVFQSVGPVSAGFSVGYDVNASGQVTGFGANGTLSQAFGPSSSGPSFIGSLSLGTSTVGHGINDNGDVAGQLRAPSSTRAFTSTGGTMQVLGTLGGLHSWAYDINNSGLVVGASYLPGNLFNHAFVANGGLMTDLGTLGGTYSNAYSIDISGRIVGGAANTNGFSVGAIWESINGVYNAYALDPLVNDGVINTGWSFVDARSISDNGRFIVAYGNNVAQGYSGFVLLEANAPASVTPEPMTFALLGTGLAGLAAVRRRKKKMETS